MPVFELDSVPNNDLDATADGLVSDLPEPQQHAIDQATADAQADPATANDTSLELDALGVPWDPQIHATSSTTGKGVRTAKGAWRKRKGIAGSAPYLNTSAAAGATKPAEDPAETARKNNEAQCRIAGQVIADVMFNISAGVGGPAFMPGMVAIPGSAIVVDERQMMRGAWGDYCVAKGMVDVPPGIALTGAMFFYYAPRFRHQEVRTRFSGVGRFFKSKFEWVYFKFKYRKSGGRPPEGDKSRRAPETIDSVSDAAGRSA